MNYKRIAELLTDQIDLCTQREKALLEQNRQQSIQLQQQSILIENLTAQVATLTAAISSLEEVLLQKNNDVQKLNNKNRGLGKLLNKGSERIIPQAKQQEGKQDAPAEDIPVFSPKDRGNNNAKRKDHYYLEEKYHYEYPPDPDFDKDKARILGYTDSIRYEYKPPCFIKHIYRQYRCSFNDLIYTGKAPRAPLNNSNYEESFIAGMLELRYIYSMPVERIVKLFNDNGFELSKSTAHGLLKKSAYLLDRLGIVLKKEILRDGYLSMDESYYTVLTKEKNKDGKGVRKGYIWAALGNNKKLIQYFYKNGSRKQDVLLDYIGPDYRGAIQSDGLANYKILETDKYPDITRLSCFQHCKRQFLDIEKDADAERIVNIINKLYRKEHEIKENQSLEKKLRYRQKYAPPILKELKKELLKIQSDPLALPQSPLSKAVNYTLKEYDALCNYIKSHEYALDNNAIERCMRYISLSRKNSLFCGSHAGAERTALFYSLACSCRLNGINTFEYFADILNQVAYIKPNETDEVYKKLLPNMWKK